MTQTTRIVAESPPSGRSPVGEWLALISGKLERPSTPMILGAAAVGGILFDFAIRSRVPTIASAICIVAGAVILLASRRVQSVHARVLLAAVPLFAVWFPLRTSPSLLALDVLACGVLMLLGATLARSASIWDLTVPRLVVRSLQAMGQLVLAPAFLARSFAPTPDGARRNLCGIVRGIVIAVPLVLVLSALLASADVIFARIFDLDAGEWFSHAAVVVIGTIGMGTLLRFASVQLAERSATRPLRLGVMEWTIVLGALDVLFGAFAIVRLVALSEGGRRVIESAGLTYAEYARSGFFQLLAVAAIAGLTLVTLRVVAATEGAEGRFKLMALVAVILTLAIVVSAFHRLMLYEGAFGLTLLRVYSHTAIVWVGLVLVLLGVVLLIRPGRSWLTPAAGISALALLLALNVLSPDAFVARHNLANERRTATFDALYLLELGDDAIPEIVVNLDRVERPDRTYLRNAICADHDRRPGGWRRFNVSRHRADDARRDLCRR